MSVESSLQDDTIQLRFASVEEIQPFVETALQQQGFFVSLEKELPMFRKKPVALLGGEGFELRLEAEVIQVIPQGPGKFGTALQIVGWDKKKEAELQRKLQAAARDADAQPSADIPTIFSIRDMNVTEKMRFAIKAKKSERMILLQDSSPQVLTALLGNPRIEEDEVLQMCKSTHISGGLLQQIAGNQRWGALYEVQKALVLNPKTPTPLAMRLLEVLRTPDLQMLAKSQRIREDLKRHALRLYLKRTQR